MNYLKYWLALTQIPNLGNVKIKNLIIKFKSIENILNASLEELVKVEGISKNIAEQIKNLDLKSINSLYETIVKKDIKTLTIDNINYPALLKEIHDPPPILYYKGNLTKDIFNKTIAIVGTRHSSVYGNEIAKNLAYELSKYNITIVSGLAEGIDTYAHKGVLENNGKTIAVLGTSPDVIYPARNKEVYDKILKQGLIISEYPPVTLPEPGRFPARNRIISGLSQGVIIVEAPEKSGALITVDFALEQGKEVFVVPGNINNPKNKGCHNLIKQGANLITDVNDILTTFNWINNKEYNLPKNLALNEQETKIYNLLISEPLHIDRIIEISKLPYSDVVQILFSLEIKGIIKQLPGNSFVVIK